MDRTDRNFLIGAGVVAAAATGIFFLLSDRKKSGGESKHGYSVLLSCREPVYGNEFFEVSDPAEWQIYRSQVIKEAADAAIEEAVAKARALSEFGNNAEAVSTRDISLEVWAELFPECGQPDQEGREDLEKYFRVICADVLAILNSQYNLAIQIDPNTRWFVDNESC